jgi:hypothetical protein
MFTRARWRAQQRYGVGRAGQRFDPVGEHRHSADLRQRSGDTINATATSAATIIGGNDSAEGNDCLLGSPGGTAAYWVFGNGGADTINTTTGSATPAMTCSVTPPAVATVTTAPAEGRWSSSPTWISRSIVS